MTRRRLVRGVSVRLASALTVVATLTTLLGLLVLGVGPGSEATRYAIADNYGMNRRGVLVLGLWVAGVIATLRLYRNR